MDIRAMITGLAAGAGTMFILDPQRGNRRRAIARDKAKHLRHRGADYLMKAGRDLTNRVQGTIAETRANLRHEEVDNDTLEARVRAHLGRAATHPGSIEVQTRAGVVTLKGPVPAGELDHIIDQIETVRGVREVRNELRSLEVAQKIPSLQGEGKILRRRIAPPPGRVLGSLFGAVGSLLLLGTLFVPIGRRGSRRERLSRRIGEQIRGRQPEKLAA